jgi:hypothetical protein
VDRCQHPRNARRDVDRKNVEAPQLLVSEVVSGRRQRILHAADLLWALGKSIHHLHSIVDALHVA